MMQTSLIIESNGCGKEKLEELLKAGWTVFFRYGKSRKKL